MEDLIDDDAHLHGRHAAEVVHQEAQPRFPGTQPRGQLIGHQIDDVLHGPSLDHGCAWLTVNPEPELGFPFTETAGHLLPGDGAGR